jgi:ribosomal protein RSM22 (predicted rRNA methylase)
MQLPDGLREAIESEVSRVRPDALAKAASELSDRYRAGARAKPAIWSDAHRVAYVAARLPATFAAVKAVLLETRERSQGADVKSVLDLGAGPGTVMWAAREVFGDLERVTMVERDEELIRLGRRLAVGLSRDAIASAEWQKADLRSELKAGPHDLVVISYALGELDEATARKVVRAAWRASEKLVAIIEPGTPRGFSNILAARAELIDLGAAIIAPCPHASACPMAGRDWCHFAERVERASYHRRLKLGTLGYEDEKFSYVVGGKTEGAACQARVVRHPMKFKGHVNLELCASTGLRRLTVSRKRGEAYKRARKAEWGSAWRDEHST